MKIGEALRTQASSLYFATPIGAPMYPAPIGVADRTRKNNYWRTVSGQHCPLAERVIGAPIYWRTEHNKWTKLLGFRVHSQVRRWGKIIECTNNRWNKLFIFCGRPTEEQFSFSHLLSTDRTKKFFKKRQTKHFGAPRLFSHQSPINWALQKGNGNTSKKRWRQH